MPAQAEPARTGTYKPAFPFLRWVEEVRKIYPDLDPDQATNLYLRDFGLPPKKELIPEEDFLGAVRAHNPQTDDVQLRNYYRATIGVAQKAYDVHLKNQGGGVPQDYEQAREWYLKAAEQGHAAAQYNLGVLYDKGLGFPQDVVEAYAWVNVAAAQGYSKAIGLRNRVRKALDGASLVRAQAQSKIYYEKYVVPFR